MKQELEKLNKMVLDLQGARPDPEKEPQYVEPPNTNLQAAEIAQLTEQINTLRMQIENFQQNEAYLLKTNEDLRQMNKNNTEVQEQMKKNHREEIIALRAEIDQIRRFTDSGDLKELQETVIHASLFWRKRGV